MKTNELKSNSKQLEAKKKNEKHYKVNAELVQMRFYNPAMTGVVSPVNITPGGQSQVTAGRTPFMAGTPIYPGGIPYVPVQGAVRGMAPQVSPFSSLYQQYYPGLRGLGSYLPVGSPLGGPLGNLSRLFRY